MPVFATWNINSIRPRMEHLADWLRHRQPDVVMLQETKVLNDAFPREMIEDAGYNLAIHGQKTFNGVAILSRGPLEDITTSLPGEPEDEQARYIEAVTTLNGQVYRVSSVYVPNGQEVGSDKFAYKLRFLGRLCAHAEKVLPLGEPWIMGGDYNVAPEPIDVYDPKVLDGTVCFHPSERAGFRTLLYAGMRNAVRCIHEEEGIYSWWDYRERAWDRNHGLNIDHLLLSPAAADRLVDAGVDREERAKDKPSDHAPVWCGLE
jgi:exodeoxyribonuclease-3